MEKLNLISTTHKYKNGNSFGEIEKKSLFFVDAIERILSDGHSISKILDIGCNDGTLLYEFLNGSLNKSELQQITAKLGFVIEKYSVSYGTKEDIDLLDFLENFDFYHNHRLEVLKEFPTHYYSILKKI